MTLRGNRLTPIAYGPAKIDSLTERERDRQELVRGTGKRLSGEEPSKDRFSAMRVAVEMKQAASVVAHDFARGFPRERPNQG